MKKLIAFFILSFVVFNSSLGQAATIKGPVIDTAEKKKIANISVLADSSETKPGIRFY